MAKYQVLYWHDIPVQVKARDKDGRFSQPLADRFQVAVDNAAMDAGLTGSEAYIDGFRWSPFEEREGSAQAVGTAVAAELEAAHERINWRQTAAALKANIS